MCIDRTAVPADVMDRERAIYQDQAQMEGKPEKIWDKIVEGKIPSRKVYEDEQVFAFHDISPWAPVHFLLIPKQHIPSMAAVTPEHAGLLGHMMTLAPKLAAQEGCNPYPEGGFRLVIGLILGLIQT